MNGNLVIMQDGRNTYAAFGFSGMPVAVTEGDAMTAEGLEQSLRLFMKEWHIDCKEIKNIIYVTDFTCLLEKKQKCTFGYLQVGDTADSRLQKRNILDGIELEIHNLCIAAPESDNYRSQLEKALDSLHASGIDKLALHILFSTLNPYLEERLTRDIGYLYPGVFEIFSSHSYANSNYMLRENALFLDLLLGDTVKASVGAIKSMFAKLGIDAPIYFMRGSGALTTLNAVVASPVSTWQAWYSALLTGAGRAAGEKDALVLTGTAGGIRMGIIKDYCPRMARIFSSFRDLHIPNSFPMEAYFDTSLGSEKFNGFLKHNNPFLGPVPIISMDEVPLPGTCFNYPVKKLKMTPSIIAAGALSAGFRLEESSIVSSGSADIEAEKEKLLIKCRAFLEDNNIRLKNETVAYELIPMKYTLQYVMIIKLCMKGDIGE